MVSALDSGASGPGFEPWPGTLCCVPGQDTLLSRCLSPPRIPANLMLGVVIAASYIRRRKNFLPFFISTT